MEKAELAPVLDGEVAPILGSQKSPFKLNFLNRPSLDLEEGVQQPSEPVTPLSPRTWEDGTSPIQDRFEHLDLRASGAMAAERLALSVR